MDYTNIDMDYKDWLFKNYKIKWSTEAIEDYKPVYNLDIENLDIEKYWYDYLNTFQKVWEYWLLTKKNIGLDGKPIIQK